MRYQDFLDMSALTKYANAMNGRAGGLDIHGQITAEILRDRILESGGHCEWCNVNLVDNDFEIDHIYTLSRGGAHDKTNLAVVCPDCNRHKAEKHPATFAQEIVAQTGQQTPLILRVLTHYGVENVGRQISLFDNDDEKPHNADSASHQPFKW